MAAVARKPVNNSNLSRLVENVAERIDVALNGRLSTALRSSTSMTPPKGIFDRNPKFGVNIAMQSTVTRDWTKHAAEFAKFTIEEARDRISSLIDGDFFVDSFQDLVDYLKERSLALESRIFQGNIINYLIDTKTKQSIPAAQVHPALSHKNTKSLEMRSSLRRIVGSTDPAASFGSWQGMSMMMSNSNEGMAYTVSGDKAYFGKLYGYATTNADENMAIIRRARAEGVELILPHRDGHDSADLVAGMPILRASKSMTATDVHPSLDHRNLTMTYGQSMFDLYEDMARKTAAASNAAREMPNFASAQVVSFEDFKARYSAPKNAPNTFADSDDDGFGFGGTGGTMNEKRIIGLRRGDDSMGSLAVWDLVEDVEISMAPNCLPEGEYKRFAFNGEVEGYTIVGNRGALSHYDQRRQPIKETRPEPDYAQEEEFSAGPQLRLK